MGNSDPVLSMLKDFGYSVVRLPRTNIRPLQILSKQNNDLAVIGSAADLFIPGNDAPLPPVDADADAAFINGRRTRALNISVGLSILGSIISAMTGSKLKLELGYKRASNIAFEFDNVKQTQINQINLNKFLTQAQIDHAVGPTEAMLNADELYIIVSTLKCTKVTTDATDSKGVSVGLDVPIIKGIVGGELAVKTENADSSKLTYEGDVPVVFGFQALRMDFEDGLFGGLTPIKTDSTGLKGLDGDGKKTLGDEKLQFETLMTDSPFVNLLH